MPRTEGNLAEQLREAIEEAIATGRLAPGTRLDEVDLATRFKVSRTPIREALRMLRGEGLIETSPGRGAIVTRLGPERLVEMFEVMAELEAMCVRLAVRRMSDAELEAIRDAHDGCRGAVRAKDADAYFYANEHFHYALYTASHSTFLFDEAAALQRRLRPYRRLQLRVPGRVARSFAEHQTVVDALAARDADAAIALIRSHVVVQGERFADLVASIADLDRAPPPAARKGKSRRLPARV